MVTGIEIAGLALAAFPVVISYLEHYRSGLETLKEWWKFRTEFLSFLNEVGVQSVFYTENLEALLAPIVPSDVEMRALLDDPGGPPWQDPTLEQRLKERLPKSYDWYRLRVEAIDNILEDMKKRLGIKPGVSALAASGGFLLNLRSVLNMNVLQLVNFDHGIESKRQDSMGV